MKPIQVFIGYDAREAVAYHTCANSIIRNCSVPVSITPLSLKLLSKVYQEQHSPETGKTGYKPTNQFIFSRFLAPYLCDWVGVSVFLDGDMVVREGVDFADLVKAHDLTKAVSVVKHDYQTKYPIKYLGQENKDYPRKNWSSVIVWSNAHYGNRKLTPAYIEEASGEHLHRFGWLDDHEIGELPAIWNWLPDEYGHSSEAKLLHWTAGTPCFQDYATSPMAEEWHRERILTQHSHQIGIE